MRFVVLSLLFAFAQPLYAKNTMQVYATSFFATKRTGEKRRISDPFLLAKKAFAQTFANAGNRRWYKAANFTAVDFRYRGQAMTAYYTAENKLAGLTRPIAFHALSNEVKSFVQKKYKGYRVAKALRFTVPQNYRGPMLLFAVSFAASDACFVELRNPRKESVVLKIDKAGGIHFFKAQY